MDIQNIRHLLGQVSAISKQYEKIADITGENFNVFDILGLSTSEVRTHTALIAELLDPKGSHRQREVFLQLFCDQMDIKEFEYEHATLQKEKHIGFIPNDYSEGGYIDIIITDKNGNAIVIENKINAGDQEKQLLRYYNYCETFHTNHHLFYLTLDGKEASDWSKCDVPEGCIKNISYANDILAWLEKCKEKAVNHPILRETITQYIYLIKHLTNQTLNNNMKNELIEMIVRNPEYIKSTEEIANVWDACINKIITDLEKHIKDIAGKLGMECVVNEKLGDADTAFWFYKKDWCYAITFYFESRKSLLVGIDNISNENKCQDDIRLKLAGYLSDLSNSNIGLKKNSGYETWIWVAPFLEWEKTSWDNIQAKIPNAILETTKIFTEKLESFKLAEGTEI